MKIINILGLYPAGLAEKLLKNSKSKLDFAANNFQEAMVKGYKENNADYHIINAPFIGSWPLHYRKITVDGWVDDQENIDSVCFFNVALIKRKAMLLQVKRRIIEYVERHANEDLVVIFYNFNFISLAQQLKRINPRIKTCLLVTDLPEYMASNSKSWISRLNRIISRRDDSYGNYIDAYILLAERMKERLPVGHKPYYIMEGIYNTESTSRKAPKSSNKTILYTGNMDPRYGVEDLVNSFSLIKEPNYELWIRGNGQAEAMVRERAKIDSRIKLIGRLSHEELLNLESSATLLVNPVHSSEEFTNFFFPSKTMEYLASGTPTVMCKLGCLPNEYLEHLYFFENESIECISETIKYICELPELELRSFGNKAQQFVLQNKTPKAQIAGLLNFLNKITTVQ